MVRRGYWHGSKRELSECLWKEERWQLRGSFRRANGQSRDISIFECLEDPFTSHFADTQLIPSHDFEVEPETHGFLALRLRALLQRGSEALCPQAQQNI